MGLGEKWKKQAEKASARGEERLAELKQKQADSEDNLQRIKEHKTRMKSDPHYAIRYKKNQHGLDFESYTEEDLRKRNAEQVDKLISSTYVDDTFNLGIDLAGASTRDLYHVGRIQIQQNFIIIRQNEQLIKELKKLNQK